MKYLLSFLTLTLAVSMTSSISAQYLISSELVEQMTKEEVEAELDREVRTGVSLYAIEYMTLGSDGLTDTASGLIAIPDEFLVEEIPIVCYQHGTTNGPNSVPSLLTNDVNAAIGYGGMGYVVSAPDYLGLGSSRGFHPYLHSATQASAGLDMLIATTEFVESQHGAWTGPLFVAGYSQGGHAAAALQRELEENWSLVFPLTASTPMSGPYDMSGVMYDHVVSDAIYFFPAYLAYVAIGYQEVYQNIYNELSDVFKQQYVSLIEFFANDQITTFELNAALTIALVNNNQGQVQPIQMLRDSVIDILRNDSLTHPLKDAIWDNSLVNWVPQIPTRLLYCEADEQVPYKNSTVADSTMNANGAPDVASMSMGADLDHSGCGEPAFAESIRFFDSFLVTSSSKDVVAELDIQLWPNPATRSVTMTMKDGESVTVEIMDMQGRRLLQTNITDSRSIDISQLHPGLYLVHAWNNERRGTLKLYIE